MAKLSSHTGIYSRTKFKAFTALASLDHQGTYWVPSRCLILNSGAPFHSTATLLPWWLECAYVQRHLCQEGFGSGDYQYKMTGHGRNWLMKAQKELLNASIFEKELQNWWAILKPEYSRLESGKFQDCVKFLAENYQKALILKPKGFTQ